jgi:trehalose synthase
VSALIPETVQVSPLPPERLRDVLDEEEWREFDQALAEAREVLHERAIWNVNSTAAGGGVAEMLRFFLAYTRGAGIDVRWLAIAGTPEFFRITKRIHNFVHGSPGDGGELGDEEAAIYRSVTAENAEQLVSAIRPGDVVLLHDPQTAGLAHRLKETGATVVWRSHIGAEQPNELVERAWSFLAPHLDAADACVFSRRAYVPAWAKSRTTEVIQPSIDVFSPKNQDMDGDAVRAILAHVGLVVNGPSGDGATFTRQDGSPGRVDHFCEVLSTGPPPRFDTPTVVQVSRWDRLKDPVGVISGFAQHVVERTAAHLILAGPTVHSVADDPEGAEVLDESVDLWRGLPHATRSRIHLACIPMLDLEENAAIVNALQRHATVIVQKSLQEGFGLTVAEGMWKARPVVASRVGGIQDQIIHGETGLLLDDPRDPKEFGEALVQLLEDHEQADRLGAQAHEHVRHHFLANRHAIQYIRLFASMFR